MTYRNDHDAARTRLGILEDEHRVLVDELARARAQKARAARKAWMSKLVPQTLESKVALAVIGLIAISFCASLFA